MSSEKKLLGSIRNFAGFHRTICQWPALRSYFLSQEDVEKAGRVKRVALNLTCLLYMHFLNFILGPLNTFNTLFQSEESKTAIVHDPLGTVYVNKVFESSSG